jgi:hypothetical protein
MTDQGNDARDRLFMRTSAREDRAASGTESRIADCAAVALPLLAMDEDVAFAKLPPCRTVDIRAKCCLRIIVWQWVMDLIEDPDAVFGGMKNAQERTDDANQESYEWLEAISRLITEKTDERDHLIEEARHFRDNLAVRKKYRGMIDEASKALDELETQKRGYEKKVEQGRLSDTEIEYRTKAIKKLDMTREKLGRLPYRPRILSIRLPILWWNRSLRQHGALRFLHVLFSPCGVKKEHAKRKIRGHPIRPEAPDFQFSIFISPPSARLPPSYRCRTPTRRCARRSPRCVRSPRRRGYARVGRPPSGRC